MFEKEVAPSAPTPLNKKEDLHEGGKSLSLSWLK